MNSDIAAGKWKQMMGKAKQFWGELTDDDIRQAEGGSDKLKGILQEKYGRSKEQAEDQMKQFMDRNNH